MKNQNIKTKNKLKIVITSGDESGVGPEVILKALFSEKIPKNIEITLVGSKKHFESTFQNLKNIGIKNIVDPNNFEIFDMHESTYFEKNKKHYGEDSFNYLKKGIEIVQKDQNSALVTGPICKKSWSLAGHNYSGQTELLAETCEVKNVGMLFTAKSPITNWRFNTLLASTHIPLSEVPKKLNSSLIQSKLDLLLNFCCKYTKNPILKVAGLNPHAGEEGMLGNEEKDWLNDAIINWRKLNKGIEIFGPLSPDTCWSSSAKAWSHRDSLKHDGILAMYHDQGLIPIKVITLNHSVNTTIGLPFIRTSPDHGTGFDIAGQGLAQSESMLEAIKTAIELNKY